MFVVDFNRRFNKLYNNIPREINPLQQATKVTYVGDFDADFSMALRERRAPNLLIMQDDAIDIEGNMIASGKMKQNSDQVDKKKIREDCDPLNPAKDAHEARMDEMSRLIRNMTNKMSRFEMENGNANKSPQEGGVRNPNQFRRPFNPQLMRRERRNDEQPIHPPCPTNDQNNLVEEETDEGYIDNPEDIHLFAGGK
jgi:hypothetical protein